jgi:ribosome-interacting GTPase 1
MPANLPPTYHEAEERYRSARSSEDKLAALEEMLRIIPKHKGTDKLQADLKARMAKLKRQPRKKGATASHSYMIPREGAGQIALVGPPNGGKSALVDRLTHASPAVAEYPFTTREPLPGMMPFEDIAFQLIDLPPIAESYIEPWVFDLIRRADLLWLVVEVTNSLDELEETLRLLESKRIAVHPAIDEPVEEPDVGVLLPALLVVTGRDRPESGDDLEILRGLLERPWPIAPVSAIDGSGLDELGRMTFDALKVIRIYTKQPGKPPDRDEPFALRRGSTVADLARTIHKDLASGFKFARVWGEQVFDGQSVQQEHVLDDGDVVEIHW